MIRVRGRLFAAPHFGRNWPLATAVQVAITVANGGRTDIGALPLIDLNFVIARAWS